LWNRKLFHTDVSECPRFCCIYKWRASVINLLFYWLSYHDFKTNCVFTRIAGRTFPNHTYFSSPLGPGQLALYNLLKAYSLLDPEVGYCQGLSFVAGVLLLHVSDFITWASVSVTWKWRVLIDCLVTQAWW
jgi:hypothetical protein